MKRMSAKQSLLFALIALLIAACAAPVAAPAGAPAAEATIAPAAEAKGKIAAILTGPPDDNSWNEAALIALQAMVDDDVPDTASADAGGATTSEAARAS